MSARRFVEAWDHAPVNNPLHLLALLALADEANERGECDPSLGSLLAKTRIKSTSTLCSVLQALEGAGHITRAPGGGRGHPTKYVLSHFAPAEDPAAPEVAPPLAPARVEKWAPFDEAVSASFGGRRVATETGRPLAWVSDLRRIAGLHAGSDVRAACELWRAYDAYRMESDARFRPRTADAVCAAFGEWCRENAGATLRKPAEAVGNNFAAERIERGLDLFAPSTWPEEFRARFPDQVRLYEQTEARRAVGGVL